MVAALTIAAAYTRPRSVALRAGRSIQLPLAGPPVALPPRQQRSGGDLQDPVAAGEPSGGKHPRKTPPPLCVGDGVPHIGRVPLIFPPPFVGGEFMAPVEFRKKLASSALH